MDQDQLRQFEELRRSNQASRAQAADTENVVSALTRGLLDEIFMFTTRVREIANLGENEPEMDTFNFVATCIQARLTYCLPMLVHHREDFARELAHVITSVG